MPWYHLADFFEHENVEGVLSQTEECLQLFFFGLMYNTYSTPGWWSYQPQNNCPETNILAEAQDALKNAFLFSGIVPNKKCHTP